MKTTKAVLFVGVLLAFGPACSQGADVGSAASRPDVGSAASRPDVELERDREPQAQAAAPRDLAVAPKGSPAAGQAAPCDRLPGAPPSEENCKCDEKGGDPAAAKAGSDRIEDVQVGSSPAKGRADAPVTVVVFTDYECPFCKKAEATLRAIESQYGRDVRLVWKNHPLPFHNGARLAAQAALAAHEQGKFWEYHEALFAHQREIDRASLERYAEDLGLDMDKFRTAIDSERIEAQVAADSADASRLGVAGTPTFFVNGRRVIGARPLADFQSAVDEALERSAR
jgi:protein-disulfide isomerase